MQPLIMAIGGKAPIIHETAFIAPGAVIIGDVTVGPDASIWYGAIIRGDTNAVRIGARSNVQDGCILHVDGPEMGGLPIEIGEDVLIGHRCMLHGCSVESGGFVGMASTMLDGSRVETGGFLAAGAFLGPKKIVPRGEMWAGLPARKLRDLKPGEDRLALMGAAHYVHEAQLHAEAVAEHESKTTAS
ncbi:gamma carbonic anhydrase family protein [Parvularcula sp. LCG005]|uniref:gamma carbonic anhydrase family protein n=1 Tax=Parvularcula sp. LCG005 TaxID=3078805 RepID=UPI0029421A9A|nr:gamma carbonic anhydrase family protein [Parvularcula sp. LCG005]WOI53741.1 gamma carbonic anhydrase family protein [Parvularcula sp. LCG005]